jgi:cytochrome P450
MPQDTTPDQPRTYDTTLLRQIYDYANRANPYPLWAELRKTPVCWQEDGPDKAGTYVVSTYHEIESLLHDPRVSSDFRNSTQTGGRTLTPGDPYTFIRLDPPEHDRLRAAVMRHFGPPQRPEYLDQLRPEILRIVTTLLDQLEGQSHIDLVEQFNLPFPVAVICRILGVPPEDQPQFGRWSNAFIEALSQTSEAMVKQRAWAQGELNQYLARLIEQHRKQPGDDLLSRMATDASFEGPAAEAYLVQTGTLLLVAGHETTVNLLGNGMLTFLRHLAILERLRNAPDLIPAAVEELLRYEGPVQFFGRTTLDDIPIAGTMIPKGVYVTMAVAAANRDPARFSDPDRFDPERRDNQHLGFGSGIHICFGAPLARIEAQIAFTELLRRLEQPRLAADPPPYRPSPGLRGPEHLWIDVERVRPSQERRAVHGHRFRSA